MIVGRDARNLRGADGSSCVGRVSGCCGHVRPAGRDREWADVLSASPSLLGGQACQFFQPSSCGGGVLIVCERV